MQFNHDLKLIVLENMQEFGKKVEKHIQNLRKDPTPLIVPVTTPRFNNGEAKVVIENSIRGKDVFILSDMYNYSLTYKMNAFLNHYSPDDHFRDVIRVVCAAKGHAYRTNVVMPFLYESRQHRRKARESLDCASSLQELHNYFGVDTIITFDVHDPEICNALPLSPFENIYPTGAILKDFIEKEKNLNLNNLIIICPDEGAAERASFYANVFQTELGLFTKSRDYTKVTDGRNKILSHRYSGPDLTGKDVIVVDDMIASGDSMLDVARQAKERNAKNIYLIATFVLFATGIENFKKAYKEKAFTKVYTTNLTYLPKEYKKEKWLEVVDCSMVLAKIINSINKNESITELLDDKKDIAEYIQKEKKLDSKKVSI